jgi:uncharacterized membrane protein YedE/YeeE
MFADLGFETLTAPQAAVWFGLALGLAFGALAQVTAFCLRRGLVGTDRRGALAVWLAALAVATLGTQIAIARGWVAFDDHRLMTGALPIAAILLGGLLFGAGMVLARGCVARLTVLGAGGNLRALTVVTLFAVTAHATLKGILSPLRTSIGSVTLDLPSASLAALPGGAALWTGLITASAAAFALHYRPSWSLLAGAAAIGALVPLGWVGTGLVLFDEFEPIALESLSFTAPWADSLFFTVASTAIPANFGIGLIGGTLVGAGLLAALRGQFRWQSFTSPRETGRYLAGAVLMGFGGVLAGGCTVGAGLAGIPTLSVAAFLALLAMVGGALATDRLLSGAASGSAGSSPKPQAIPAE